MRALAEFIMKGRLQAVAVAGLGVGTLVFAWVGVAAAILVLLRKGLAEGAYVVFWALLPAIAVATEHSHALVVLRGKVALS
ncbi:MAG: hypothetical protein KKG73_02245, partial [Gammaproteobacteria bacterium]|nr:hypothetical protein [Gammaproteobacteria bacterium]